MIKKNNFSGSFMQTHNILTGPFSDEMGKALIGHTTNGVQRGRADTEIHLVHPALLTEGANKVPGLSSTRFDLICLNPNPAWKSRDILEGQQDVSDW